MVSVMIVLPHRRSAVDTHLSASFTINYLLIIGVAMAASLTHDAIRRLNLLPHVVGQADIAYKRPFPTVMMMMIYRCFRCARIGIRNRRGNSNARRKTACPQLCEEHIKYAYVEQTHEYKSIVIFKCIVSIIARCRTKTAYIYILRSISRF